MKKKSIASRVRTATGAFLKSLSGSSLRSSGIGGFMGDSGSFSKSEAMKKLIGWTYACINAISEEIGNMELELYKVNSDGSHERVWEHDLIDLLHAVNTYMTGYDLRYITGSHLEATGNAYWFLGGVDKAGDVPNSIHPLDPSKVSIKLNTDSIPYSVKHYELKKPSGGVMKFQPYQIIHIKYPNPSNIFEGKGTVQAISKWIEAEDQAVEFNRAFFKNGAKLSGLLEADSNLSPEQMEVLRDSFLTTHRGTEKAYGVAALPKGVKYTEMGQTLKDMDFAGLSIESRDKILAAFRVPRTVLGITDDVNRANAEATDYVYAKRTIKPKYRMITECLNEFLVPLFGEDIYLSFKDPVPENEEMNIKKMQAAMASQPVMSHNEARDEFLGLPPITGGDSVMTDYSKIPLGKPLNQKEIGQEKEKSTKGKGKPSTKYSRVHKKRKELAKELTEKISNGLKENIRKRREAKLKGIDSLTDEEFAPFYKAFFMRVTSFEEMLMHKVQQHNVKQQEEVLENLESAIKSINKKNKGIDPDQLFALKDNVVAMIDLAAPILVDLWEAESSEAADMIGMSGIEELSPETLERINSAVQLMAESYNETTLNQLKDKIEQALEAGASLNEVKEVVSDIYEFADNNRALRLARTESFRIANESSKDTWKQSGVVKTIKWFTSADERVCEWCAPQHGKVVSIDSNFYDIGDEVVGLNGGYFEVSYANVEAGSLHASCRCYTRPETISID